MSKIGKKHILVPSDVKVQILENKISFEGPKGKKTLEINTEYLKVSLNEGKIIVEPKDPKKQNKIIWGLQRSLINNAVKGVVTGHKKVLDITGVGFRANLKGDVLNLQLGFSHDVNFKIPKEVKITVEKQTSITIDGVDKELVSKVASDIKALKPVEPYKGKGIRERGQYVLKKEGKKK